MSKTEKQHEVIPIPDPNAFYERLLDLRRTNPKAFDVISPASKLALFHYEAGRREHFRIEAIRNEADVREV